MAHGVLNALLNERSFRRSLASRVDLAVASTLIWCVEFGFQSVSIGHRLGGRWGKSTSLHMGY